MFKYQLFFYLDDDLQMDVNLTQSFHNPVHIGEEIALYYNTEDPPVVFKVFDVQHSTRESILYLNDADPSLSPAELKEVVRDIKKQDGG